MSFLKTLLKKSGRLLFKILAFILYYSGFLIIYLRLISKKKLLVVFYHEVGFNHNKLSSLVTKPRNFEKQIHFLCKWFTPVPVELVNNILSGEFEHGHPVLITFDGGYKGNLLHALPILERYKSPAVIYIVTESVEKGEVPWTTQLSYIIRSTKSENKSFMLNGDRQLNINLKKRKQTLGLLKQKISTLDQKEREKCVRNLSKLLLVDLETLKDLFMNWEDVKEIERSDLITIGSHTISHPRLIEIEMPEAKTEIAQSRMIIEEHLGIPVESFCYPDGKINRDIIKLVEDAGYQSATTTLNGLNRIKTNPYTLRRIGGGDMSIYVFAMKLSGLLRRLYG